VHHIKDDAINNEPLNNEVAAYDRLQRIKFGLPNAQVGSILDYAYRVKVSKVDTFWPLLADMYFLSDVPALEQQISITHLAEVEIADLFENEKFAAWPILPMLPPQLTDVPALIASEEQSEAGIVVKTYRLGPIGGYIPDETQTPPWAHFAPRVLAGTAADWAKIGVEYDAAARRILTGESPAAEIKQKPIEAARMALKLDATDSPELSPREVLEAAFDRIARKMNHVPVSMAEYDFLPQNPLPLAQKDLANELDKAHIFIGACKMRHIDAKLVLVRSRGAGPVVESVASLRQFTTPLVRVELDGVPIYCFFGSKNLRLGQLPPEVQNVKGLLIDGDGSRLIDIPPTPPSEQSAKNVFSVNVKGDGSIEVTRTTTFDGGAEASFRAMRFQTEEQLNKDMQSSIGGIHPNCRYISHKFLTPFDDFTQPFAFEVKYEISDYAMKGGDKMLLIHLPELNYFAVAQARRRMPFYFGYASESVNEYEVALPEGYRVRYTPTNISTESSEPQPFVYDAVFREEDGKLHFNDDTEIRAPEVRQDEYPAYKEKIEARARLAKEWIILEKAE